MYYGYARVSSKDQNVSRQLIALSEAGIDRKKIYVDKKSGKDFDRRSYQRLISKMKPGDALFVKSIDRFGRNYDEIQQEWHRITKEKKCDIVILDMPLLDTRSSNEFDLTGKLIADIVLQLMAFAANFERDEIKTRQAEGIAAAKERGVRFGRSPKPIPLGFDDVAAVYREGKISARKAAEMLDVSHPTFLKWFDFQYSEASECTDDRVESAKA